MPRFYNRFENDIKYGGSKSEVYFSLTRTYFIEPMAHPAVTRKYLRLLDNGRIDNPEHEDVLSIVIPDFLTKHTLYFMLDQVHQHVHGNVLRLGIKVTALPSKQWLLAAINQLDPENQFLRQLVMLNELQSSISGTGDNLLATCENLSTLLKQYIMSLQHYVTEFIKTKIYNLVIIKLDRLLQAYPFINLTQALQQKLDLI